jgi:hypothetical protein
MPSTVRDVLVAAGLEPQGSVAWGTRIPETGPGVYVVALTDEADAFGGLLAGAPISEGRADELLTARPELCIDGIRPDGRGLMNRLRSFWLPDEIVLYIGLAGTSVRTRVNQY